MSQIQRILAAISDQFGNCIVKYTRLEESLNQFGNCIVKYTRFEENYSCRRYSKHDNVDVFPHRDTSQ